jgi:SAM-dependent methyltransferase
MTARLVARLGRLFPGRSLPGRCSTGSYFTMQKEHARRALLPYLQEQIEFRGGRILDLGCGHGGATSLYSEEYDGVVVGLDRNPDLLVEGMSQMPGGRFVAGDAVHLPFPDDCFQLAILDNSFEHLGDPEGSLREIRRVLAQGGRLALNFPSWRSPWGHHVYDFIPIPWINLFCSRETILQAIDESARMRTAAGEDPDYVEHWRGRTAVQFKDGLNEMTLARLKRALAGTGPWKVHDFSVRFFSRWAKPLGFLPGAGELFTRRFDVVLQKAEYPEPPLSTGKAFRRPFLEVLSRRISSRK